MNLSAPIIKTNENIENFNEIKQGLEILMTTPAGTVPLDRNFGLDQSFLSQPTAIAETMFIQELIEKAEMYLPQISVEEAGFEYDKDGVISPIIYISANDEIYNEDEDEDDLSTDEDEYYYEDEDDPDADYYITDDEEDEE